MISLLLIFLTAVQVGASEEVTKLAPNGLYTAKVTVQKPAGMTLSSNWEIRVYVHSGINYYTTGEWWEPTPGYGEWIYTGDFDHRIMNQSWTGTTETRTFDVTFQTVKYPRTDSYPSSMTENQALAMDPPLFMDNILDEGGSDKAVTVRTRLLFRNLQPQFDNSLFQVTFKVAGTTYTYGYSKDSYDRYWLKTPDGEDVGTSAYLDQAEGTEEWRLNYRSDKTLLVGENGDITGTVTMPNTIILGLTQSTGTSMTQQITSTTGGTINIGSNATLVIPANALSESTSLTVTETTVEIPSGFVRVSKVYEIGPTGTTFETPSSLTLPYDENDIPAGASETDLAIYRRTSTGSWERLGGTVDTVANTISVQIDHLSEYAVMADTVAGSAATLLYVFGAGIAAVSAIFVVKFLRGRGGRVPKAPEAPKEEKPKAQEEVKSEKKENVKEPPREKPDAYLDF